MRRLCSFLLLLLPLMAGAVIIDRIAVVAGNSIIKDSDIERDIRVTDFLNRAPLNLSQAARKEAASRLLDQIFIRQEIEAGGYDRASVQQADEQLNKLVSARYHSQAALNAALARYGINEQELRQQFRWQLTVLQFISTRFKPAAYISEDEIAQYFNAHRAELERHYPGRTTADSLAPQITNILQEQKVNDLFFGWLNRQRKNAHLQFLEAGLE